MQDSRSEDSISVKHDKVATKMGSVRVIFYASAETHSLERPLESNLIITEIYRLNLNTDKALGRQHSETMVCSEDCRRCEQHQSLILVYLSEN